MYKNGIKFPINVVIFLKKDSEKYQIFLSAVMLGKSNIK